MFGMIVLIKRPSTGIEWRCHEDMSFEQFHRGDVMRLLSEDQYLVAVLSQFQPHDGVIDVKL